MPTIVSIQQGGTAATTASDARNNLGAVANTGDTVTGELKLLGSGTALNVANIGYFSGNVGIGTTNPATKLHVVGNVVATGSITASYSDERLKDIIQPISNALENLNQIKTIYFKANDLVKTLTPHIDDKVQLGVTAQSVKQVYPEVVIPSAIDKNYDTVQYDRLVPVLIAAVVELDKKVKELESKLRI